MNQVHFGGCKNSIYLTRVSHVKLLLMYGSEVCAEGFQGNNLDTYFSVYDIFVKKMYMCF